MWTCAFSRLRTRTFGARSGGGPLSERSLLPDARRESDGTSVAREGSRYRPARAKISGSGGAEARQTSGGIFTEKLSKLSKAIPGPETCASWNTRWRALRFWQTGRSWKCGTCLPTCAGHRRRPEHCIHVRFTRDDKDMRSTGIDGKVSPQPISAHLITPKPPPPRNPGRALIKC